MTVFPPESADYSGFVAYDEAARLLDWEINVEELDLSLNSASNDLDLMPDITFDLSSLSNWDLKIDFGIAFDAPLFELQRDTTTINFSQTSLIGLTAYSDPDANINVTSTDTDPSVPEPSAILGSLAFLSTLTILKKYQLTK